MQNTPFRPFGGRIWRFLGRKAAPRSIEWGCKTLTSAVGSLVASTKPALEDRVALCGVVLFGTRATAPFPRVWDPAVSRNGVDPAVSRNGVDPAVSRNGVEPAVTRNWTG